MTIARAAKRLLVGRKLRSTELEETLLPKRVALPVFASDALSSVAYAPDEIFLTLSMGGVAAYAVNWQIGIAVVVVMLTVVGSYRQNVRAYPSGGGDYEVATTNLGPKAGVTVASALLVDYVLTVAVSVSAGVQNASSALPWLAGHEVTAALVVISVLAAVNLRGTRESGTAFAIPTYLFMGAVALMALWGLVRWAQHDLPQAASAQYDIVAEPPYDGALTGLAMAFLLARAFSSGCAALTGVEAISNGVPAFRRPKSHNAATTLLLLGAISITLLMSIILLADAMNVRYVEDPTRQLLLDGKTLGPGAQQPTVIAQVAQALYADVTPLFYATLACTGLILFLAANTAFNGFPVLGSMLARDGHLPRQLDTRGDRLAFSNGIVLLAVSALVLVWVFDAEVTRLIQLYIVGVFISFNLSQLGMIRHWTRHLLTETDPRERRRMKRSRVVNSIGLALTATVLVVVLITKFLSGAWIAIVAMVVLFLLMRGISRHYARIQNELDVAAEVDDTPSLVHGVVLVDRLHKPTMQALRYATAAHPDSLEALHVDVGDDTKALRAQWTEHGVPVPLTVLDSPYRELVRPVIRHVKQQRRDHPEAIVSVYIPEYVVGHWWEQALHNQTALRLKGHLLFTPGVMVTSVPFQLRSVETGGRRVRRPAVGDVRRGRVPRP